MRREIGSEYWLTPQCGEKTAARGGTPFGSDCVWLLSGRTAIDYILRDILHEKNVRRAYLPSWCCETMIEPFAANGIEVLFYDVEPAAEGLVLGLHPENACEIVLIASYFGFADKQASILAAECRKRGKKVLLDATHALLGQWDCPADYRYASIRKWTGVPCGAIAQKPGGSFLVDAPEKENREYCSLRSAALTGKAEYMAGRWNDKQRFGDIFKKAEALLRADYRRYGMDAQSVRLACSTDWEDMRRRRRSNAATLLEGLDNIQGVKPLFAEMGEGDCPLFVPALVRDGRRDDLQQHLAANGIYCPIHWPHSPLHRPEDRCARLYMEPLSLVCDQRYGEEEMERLINAVKGFF